MRKYFTLIVLMLAATGLYAQNVSFLKDINNSGNDGGSNPYNLTKLGTTQVVFVAYEPTTGSELYVSDGTTTTLLKDIYPGSNGSNIAWTTNINGTIYFSANDGVNGQEIWVTDGTPAGTVMLFDLNPGPGSSSPGNFIGWNSNIYFTAFDATNGSELWATDGTLAGTGLVWDIAAGPNGSDAGNFVLLGNSFLVFAAHDENYDYELYSYDGGFGKYKLDINTSGSSSPHGMAYNPTDGKVYFAAYDPTYNWELYTTNGTSFTVTDINPGSAYSDPYGFIYYPLTGQMYFAANNPIAGYELYTVQAGVPIMLADFSAVGGSYPNYFTVSNNTLFVNAYDGSNYQFYSTTDGTSFSPVTGFGTATGINLTIPDGTGGVYLENYDATNGYELWYANSTSASLVKDIFAGANGSYPNNFLYQNGELYFNASSQNHGSELWKSDGTSVGTIEVINTNIGSDSNPNSFLATASQLMFRADNGVKGSEPWTSDGSSANTDLLKDVQFGAGSSYPTFLNQTPINGLYFFTADDGTHGAELWKTNGLTSGTALMTDINVGASGSNPSAAVVFNNMLYFTAYEASTGYELYKTDGTTTSLVADLNPGTGYGSAYFQTPVVLGSYLFFVGNDGVNGWELYYTDGTSYGMVVDLNPGAGDGYPTGLVTTGTGFFFAAYDASYDRELYYSDGTTFGTYRVADLNPSGSSSPNYISALNGKVVFSAFDGGSTYGTEAWVSDGTPGGTFVLADVWPGNSGAIYNMQSAGNYVYFGAYNPTLGYELYRTDGTQAGTILLSDINPGAGSSYPNLYNNINGTPYFTATDLSGSSLYKSNGTPNGTIKATSTGTIFTNPGKPYYFNGQIYFSGSTFSGNEPLTFKAEPVNQSPSIGLTSPTATSFNVSFTETTGVDGYIIIRTEGALNTALPVDGTNYNPGDALAGGTGTVVADVTSGAQFTDSGLNPATQYYYQVYSYVYDATANVKIYNPNNPAGVMRYTLASPPVNQPTSITFGNQTISDIGVSFFTQAGPVDNYLYLRIPGTTPPTEVPVPATPYNAGDIIGSSTVIYFGPSTAFMDGGLSQGTNYSYAIFASTGSGPTVNYLTTAPLTGTSQTIGFPPSGPSSMYFSNVDATTLTLNWTDGGGGTTGFLVVAAPNSPTTGVPTDGLIYTPGNSLGDGIVVYSGPNLTVDDFGLTPETLYFYTVYAYSGTPGLYAYNTASPAVAGMYTLAYKPIDQAVNFSVFNQTTSSFDINFQDNANIPTGYLVLGLNGATPPSEVPSNGVDYPAGSNLGSAFVVYNGPATALSFTSLPTGYYESFTIYSYNGTAPYTNYLTTSPLTGTAITFDNPPGGPSSMAFANKDDVSVDVSWQAGVNATGYVVLAKANGPSTGIPSVGTQYNVGDFIGDGVVVYDGPSSSFTASGLSPLTTYFFTVYAYTGLGSVTNYNTASPVTSGVQTLNAKPQYQAVNFSVSNVTSSSYDITFEDDPNNIGGTYIVLVTDGVTPPADVPSPGTTYSLGAVIGSSSVTYIGPVPASGISYVAQAASSAKSFAVFSLAGSGITINYLTANPLTGTAQTFGAAPSGPSNLIVSNATDFSLDLSWSAGAGADGYLVLAAANAAPTFVPSIGAQYAAGTTQGDAYVVFNGPSLSTTDAGLSPATTYYYVVYAYSGGGTGTNYNTVTTAASSGNTLAPVPGLQPSNFQQTVQTGNSVTFTFDAPAFGLVDGYIVLKVDGPIPPSDVPVPGVSYNIGDFIGSSTVIYTGPVAPVVVPGLSLASTQSYAIFSYNGALNYINYLTTFPLTGTTTTSATSAAPGAASALSITSVTESTINLTWSAGSGADGYIVVRKDGALPNSNAVPVDGTTYSVGVNNIGNGDVAYVGPNTSLSDTGLTAETDYYYLVYSYAGTGAATAYQTLAPPSQHRYTLAPQPADQPTGLVISQTGDNGTTRSFTVTFSEAPTQPFGYIVLRSPGTAAVTDVPADSSVYAVGSSIGSSTVAYITSGNSPVTDFSENLPTGSYSYAIYSFNGNGITSNFNPNSPLKGLFDATGPVIADNTPTVVDAGASLNVSVVVTDNESGIGGVYFNYLDEAKTSIWQSLTLTLNAANQKWEGTLPAANISELGLSFNVNADNSNGVPNSTANKRLKVNHPSTTLPFAGFGTSQTNYRIVSFPFVFGSASVSSVLTSLGASDGNTKWRILHYSGGSASDVTTVSLGQGYWLLAKSSTTITLPAGTTSNAQQGNEFTLNLSSGWNQIGNPYIFNLLWSDVVSASGAGANGLKLRTYNGNWNDATVLSKFEGGFVNAPSALTLVFPVIKNPAAGRSVTHFNEALTHSLDAADWEVNLTVKQGDTENKLAGFGMNPAASIERDIYDDFTLPRFVDYVEVNFNKKSFGSAFTRDIIPTSDNYQWHFMVETSKSGPAQITWDNSYFGDNDRAIMLVDEITHQAVDMRMTNSFEFEGDLAHPFRIVYGSASYVNEHALPPVISVSKLAPNPSSGAVNIGFTVPSGDGPTQISIKIVDLMGRNISTVYSGVLNPGYQEVTWGGLDDQGQRPSQGVYIVQVSSYKDSNGHRLVLK